MSILFLPSVAVLVVVLTRHAVSSAAAALKAVTLWQFGTGRLPAAQLGLPLQPLSTATDGSATAYPYQPSGQQRSAHDDKCGWRHHHDLRIRQCVRLPIRSKCRLLTQPPLWPHTRSSHPPRGGSSRMLTAGLSIWGGDRSRE
ncbi:hypothetical protein C8R46DRAFT_295799 [Mycena filopes]|nr:hypothetical protein C8R46DRAFT_295799 [Mycena filopes]